MLKTQDGRPVIVREPAMFPHKCVINPHLERDPDGYIDTGAVVPGFRGRPYIALRSFRDLAASMGWTPPDGADELDARIALLEAEIERLQAQLAAKDAALDAVAVLRQAGYQASRKPGRPPTPGKPEAKTDAPKVAA